MTIKGELYMALGPRACGCLTGDGAQQNPFCSTLGPDHEQSFKLRKILARVFCSDEASPRADLEEALTKLEEIEPRMKRVMGTFHPLTKSLVKELAKTRTILEQRE